MRGIGRAGRIHQRLPTIRRYEESFFLACDRAPRSRPASRRTSSASWRVRQSDSARHFRSSTACTLPSALAITASRAPSANSSTYRHPSSRQPCSSSAPPLHQRALGRRHLLPCTPCAREANRNRLLARLHHGPPLATVEGSRLELRHRLLDRSNRHQRNGTATKTKGQHPSHDRGTLAPWTVDQARPPPSTITSGTDAATQVASSTPERMSSLPRRNRICPPGNSTTWGTPDRAGVQRTTLQTQPAHASVPGGRVIKGSC